MYGRRAGGHRWRWLAAPFTPNGLAFFALVGFSLMSAFATAQGFSDLRAAGLEGGQLKPVDLVLTYATSAFVIAAMIVALHNALAPGIRWWVRLISAVFYLFFAVWSVGFGYGYFWKELAGQEYTRGQFKGMLTQASESLARAGLALETAEQAALGAAQLARQRADIEATQGGTCANRPGSIPGDGPLTRGRFAFADRADAAAQDVRSVWIAPLADRRAQLERQMAAIEGRSPGGADAAEQADLERLARADALPADERRSLYLGVHQGIASFATELNAMRDLHAPAFARRLSDLADEVGPAADASSDPAVCRDGVLADRLSAASAQLSGLQPVAAPAFEVIEGAKATRAAFFGLADAAFGVFGQPRQTDFPFGAREAMALFARIAVDLGIVFLTLIRLAGRRPERIDPGRGAPRPPVLETILGPGP